MSSDIPARANPSSGSSFRFRRLLQKWPLLIWIAALACVLYMYKERGTYGRVNGMVFANLEDIAASEDGIIMNVHVRDGQTVKKGQPLVTLDPSLIQREIEALEHELIIARLERTNDFQSEFTKVEEMLQKLLADQKTDIALLQVAVKKVEAETANVAAKRSLIQDLEAAQIEHDAVAARLEGYDDRITSLTKARDGAEKLVKSLAEADGSENQGEDPTELRVLKEQLKNKVLVAPADGIIQKVHKLRGVAELAEPIITFIPDRDADNQPAKMVRGFVQQKEDPESLKVDGFIWISERVKNPIAYRTKIVSVAPDITAILNYGTPVPGRFLRGREFLCELPAELAELIPGTAVHIHRAEPGEFDIWSFGKTPVKAASN